MANIINQINIGGTTYDVGVAAANVSVDPASAGVESTALEPALKEIPDNTINKYNANNLADNLMTATAGTKALDAHQGSVLQTQTNNIMDIVYGKTTRAYAAGDFFMLNNKPYCSSKAIASGTTLNDNNITSYATQLSESAINILNDKIATINGTLPNKLNTSQVVNNLTTTIAGNVLDATQGKVLNDKIATINDTKQDITPTDSITDPAGFAFQVVGNQQIEYDKLADAILAKYSAQTLMGKAQTVKSALDTANEKINTNTNNIETNASAISDSQTAINTLNERITFALYEGAWVRTSSNGLNQALTETLVLPAGLYIIFGYAPSVNSGNLSCSIGYNGTTIEKGYIIANFGSVAYIDELTEQTNVALVSTTSLSLTYSYIYRAGIKALKIK